MSSAARLRLRRGGSLFDRVHTELFGGGEQGIYMPSVHESFLRGDLYQDAAGTTPVTAVGQPVGLWSDRSKGLVLGPEYGSATPDLGLFIFAHCTAEIEGNSIKLTNTGNGYGAAYLRFPAPSGDAVRVSFAGRRATRARLYGEVANSGSAVSENFSGSTPVPSTLIMLNGYTAPDLTFHTDDNVSGTVRYIDFPISVRELPGNHASQSSSSLRPAYRVSPERIDFDGVDDKLTVTFASSLGSDCTVGLSIPGSGASILTGQTIDTSYDIDADTCGVVIVDRALTGNETTVLTQLLNKAAEV